MGRKPCCSKEGLKRGSWTALEDKILIAYMRAHGEGGWRNLPKRAGLKRCGKSCRLRWLNYLRPDIKRGNITSEEEELIIRLHNLLGNRWSLIAGRLPGRTDNEIKNYWNTSLSKKLRTTSPPPKKGNRPNSRVKKLANEPTTTEPLPASTTLFQAIRTKARRCTKVVLVSPPSSPTSNKNPQVQNDQTHEWTSNFLNIEDDDFAAKKDNFVMDSDQLLPLEKQVFNDWSGNENAPLDLEFLSFFLDSEEWTSHDNHSSFT